MPKWQNNAETEEKRRIRVFPGVSYLSIYLGHPILVTLNETEVYMGELLTFDQFGNLTLNNVFQRLVINSKYAYKPYGVMTIRSNSIKTISIINKKHMMNELKDFSQTEFDYLMRTVLYERTIKEERKQRQMSMYLAWSEHVSKAMMVPEEEEQ
ncbi:hypothetical protein PCE1_003053 [Barthelona sp. PCE]